MTFCITTTKKQRVIVLFGMGNR